MFNEKWADHYRFRPSEPIEFHAHQGVCRYCRGVVKMARDTISGTWLFDVCVCLRCGQPYHVELGDEPPEQWEETQWLQKDYQELTANE